MIWVSACYSPIPVSSHPTTNGDTRLDKKSDECSRGGRPRPTLPGRPWSTNICPIKNGPTLVCDAYAMEVTRKKLRMS